MSIVIVNFQYRFAAISMEAQPAVIFFRRIKDRCNINLIAISKLIIGNVVVPLADFEYICSRTAG